LIDDAHRSISATDAELETQILQSLSIVKAKLDVIAFKDLKELILLRISSMKKTD